MKSLLALLLITATSLQAATIGLGLDTVTRNSTPTNVNLVANAATISGDINLAGVLYTDSLVSTNVQQTGTNFIVSTTPITVTLSANSQLTVTNFLSNTNLTTEVKLSIVGDGASSLTILNPEVSVFPPGVALIPPSGVSSIYFSYDRGSIVAYASWLSQAIETIQLIAPYRVDGIGAVIQTNNYTALNWGQAIYSASAATNGNYADYYFTVPSDFTTNSTVRLEMFKDMLLAADTAARSYTVGLAVVANSASAAGSFGNYIAVPIAADASGAQYDVESISSPIVLTSWNTTLVAGRLCVIRVARDGSDASAQTSSLLGFEISYSSVKRSAR